MSPGLTMEPAEKPLPSERYLPLGIQIAVLTFAMLAYVAFVFYLGLKGYLQP